MRLEEYRPFSLGERIRQFRERRGWSQGQLAGACNVTQSQVSKWEKNLSRPSPSAFGAIAMHADQGEKALWITEAGLAVYLREDEPETRQVSVLRDPAAAGTPRAIDDNEIEEVLSLPRKWLPTDGLLYGITAVGDSMWPIVNDGNLLIVDVSRQDAKQLIGHMVVALVDDGVTVKWLRRDHGVFFLVPQNTSERHPVRLLRDTSEERIIGEVVKIIGDPPAPKRK